MLHFRVAYCTVAALILVAGNAITAVADGDDKGKKPSVSLKVKPPLSIAPARVLASVELRGGADDYEAFYCPTIEWDWGDDTKSEWVQDCDPYKAGQSAIRRRFAAEHTYHESGTYKVRFRLKQKDKVVALGVVSVQVQPGLTEPF